MGLDIYEMLTIRIPRDLREGTYDVQFKMDYGDRVFNSAVRDLLYNNDFFVGTPCTEIHVRHFVTR